MANVKTKLDQLFQSAFQLHQSGRFAEAEQLYRQILAQQPNHADALHSLGVLAAQAGRGDIAANLIRQALALRPDFPEAWNDLGTALHGTGQADEAIVACRQAIALRRDFPEAYYNLGNVLYSKGHIDDAIAIYRQAVALRPNFPQAHNNLGNALKEKGQLDEATATYRQAIALWPNYPEAHINLGTALQGKGQVDEAVAVYRQAIALSPGFPETHNNLGTALKEKGHLDQAIAAYQQAISLRPNYAEAHNNLGIALIDIWQPDNAIAAYRQAIAAKPNYPEAHNNLGNALKVKGQLDEAVAAYRQAIVLKSNYAEAHNNLGVVLMEIGQPDEAIAAYRQAIALRPNFPEAHNNLGNVLKERGELDEAIAAYRQASALRSSFSIGHSNLLFTLNFHPGYDASAIAREARLWNQQHAEQLRPFIQPHSNDRDPNRRLRIGYVSPDFGDHCQSFFTIPLLGCHDHQNFEIVCYADVPRPDALTARLRGYADEWRSTSGMMDEQLATVIRQDRIDILIDLTMHMASNRMLLFARKPAPVQVCWLAYPGTTGLRAIDYRLSDPHLDPPGMDESVYSEQTHRLPHTFWCYDPLGGRDVQVNPLPALTNGYITFGCLNNFCKVGDAVLRLWAKVLRAVPHSRLLLGVPEGSTRQRTLELLAKEGIASQRVEFAARLPRQKYLELYHRIDVGLDTFPYNGHTTSLDAFWMGVPVVTLVGQTIVGRAGLCQLMNLNLPDLIAHFSDQYVHIATDFATDLHRLTELRATLRSRMEQSPLMDAPCFARDVEAAYRQFWTRWCLEPQ